MIGKSIGPYQIIAELGRGGMGEVYRAHDAKLGRDVAIKILPDLFVADAERLARFDREARTLASLNHPNIAQIYGMEDHALVMELVEGDDLSVLLSRGPVPLAEALPIARQIAQALEAAHELGIIHRDLKPANIKVRHDGTVKVLDFGLAKAMDPSGAVSGSLANSPTMTSPATAMGMILGTAAYMSPEQARGKTVDRRADVWAFGVVLYEMLSGRRAFDGSEISDVLASVLKDTIPLDALPPDTPPAIRRLLRRCLEKNRADRLDSMTAARLEISDAMGANVEAVTNSVSTALAPPPPRRRALVIGMIAAGVVVGALGAWAYFGRTPAAPAARVVRFSIPIPTDQRTNVGLTAAGDTIVYQNDRIYVRRLDEPDPHALPGTESSWNLFLSPDGRWAGFLAGGKIKKVSTSGGDPIALASVESDTPGATWGPGNTVLFTPGWNAAIYSVSAEGGGKPVAISTVDTAAGELGHWWPEPMPDGKTVLFTIWMAATGINDSRIAALDLSTGKHRVIMNGAKARFLAPGQLLYFHAGAFQTVPFDPVTLRATGEATRVLPDAMPIDPNGSNTKTISASSGGTLAYITGALQPELQMAWVSPGGVVEPIPGPPRRWRNMELSPDGRRIAGSRVEGGVRSLWMLDIARQSEDKLDIPGANFSPVWDPRGEFLMFTSMRAGHFDAFMMRQSDGVVRPVIEEPFDQTVQNVTHDGKQMIVFDYLSDGNAVLTLADINQPKMRTRLPFAAPSSVEDLRISPDDKWVVTAVRAAGGRDVFVQPFPGAGPVVRVSSRGGHVPRWSRKGSTLYYQRDSEMVAVTYSTAGGRFTIDREQVLFSLPDYDFVDVAPDGRFLMVKETPGHEPQLRVVVNWLSELKK